MHGYKIISKGKYVQTQASLPVHVNSYVLIEENGARFLMLKLSNDKGDSVSRFSMRLIQYDKARTKLDEKELSFPLKEGESLGDFVLDDKIPLSPQCDSFTAEIFQVEYGKYEYTQQEENARLTYHASWEKTPSYDKLKGELQGEKTQVATKSTRTPFIVSLIALFMLVAISALSFLQLTVFRSITTEFKYKNIKYRFVGEENVEGGDIIIVGYDGRASELRIPESLEEHAVVSIADGAFAGNEHVRTVVFESTKPIKLGKRIFENCTNLTSVNLENVTEVGDYAFYNTGITEVNTECLVKVGTRAFSACDKLESVTMSSKTGETITLREKAFADCEALTNVTLDAPAKYDGDNLFNGCSALENMKLYNFNYRLGALQVTPKATLSATLGKMQKLSNLEIRKLGNMPAGFAKDMSIQTFKVEEFDENAVSQQAFFNCKRLESVQLPGNVTVLNEYCFANTALSFYSLKYLTKIDNYAFMGSALKDVDLDFASTCTLGEGVFMDCKKLTKATVTSNLSLPKRTFKDCTSLIGVVFGKNVKPAEIQQETFSGCTQLISVALPDSVETIDPFAFAGCTNLVSFLFSPVDAIGEGAFQNCASLAEINLPSTVLSVGESAFKGCSTMTKFTAGDSLGSIGKNAFQDCIALKEISLPCVWSGSFKTLFVSTGDSMPAALTTVTVTGNKNLHARAFEGCDKIMDVALSGTPTSIGPLAFSGCSALTKMSLPASLTSMENKLFLGCSAMQELTLPLLSGRGASNLGYFFGGDNGSVPDTLHTVTVNGSGEIPREAFSYCYFLKKAVVEEGVTKIGDNAFYYCNSLKSVDLPEGLQTIGQYAFSHCLRLQDIALPEGLSSLGGNAFSYCYRLYEIGNAAGKSLSAYDFLNVYTDQADKMPTVTKSGYTFSKNGDVWYLTDYPTPAKGSVSLPKNFYYNGESVSSYRIAPYLFYGEAEVKELTLPEGVEQIKNDAFYGCVTLEKVVLPSTLQSIGDNAFSNCPRLFVISNHSALSLVKGSTTFGEVAKNALTIGQDNAFMKVLTINKLEYVKDGNVWYVVGVEDGVKEVTLTSFQYGGVTANHISIHQSAFTNDYALTSVVLQSAVKEMAPSAFASCGNLKTANLTNSSLTLIPEKAFYNCYSLTTLSLPATVTKIGSSAFQYNGSLKNVTFAANSALQTIGQYAFANCSSLEKISLPSRVTTIENSAFYSCYGLTSITFPSTLQTIGSAAFESASLEKLVFPSSLTSIQSGAFRYNDNLREVTLNSRPTIGSSAFYECSHLYEIYNCGGLSLTTGSSANGYLGYYALAVYTSTAEARKFAETDQCIFVKKAAGWTLHKWKTSSQTVDLPETFTVTERNGTTYTVDSYRLESSSLYTPSNCRYLVIPVGVSYIPSALIQNLGYSAALCYKGSSAQWSVLTSGISVSKSVYYKADCIHDNTHWRYTTGGAVTLSTDVTVQKVGVAATCTSVGRMDHYCAVCNALVYSSQIALASHQPNRQVVTQASCTAEGRAETHCANCQLLLSTEALEKVPHTPDANGKCIVCQQQGTLVTANNWTGLGFKNSTSYPYVFDEEKGIRTPTGIPTYTSVSLEFKATRAMTVQFTAKTVSFSYEQFVIYLNGTTQATMTNSSGTAFTFHLQAGDVLKFTLSKRYSTGNGYASITDFLIF